jgi:hypothetical protein
MKPAIFGLAAACLVGATLGRPTPASATEVGKARPLGFGFALGVPTSLVGKYFLNASNAVDFGLSFGRLGRHCANDGAPYNCDGIGNFGFFGDYLWHDTLARGTAQLDWHFGPGGRLWIGNDDRGDNVALAARLPVGLDLTFDRPDFLELFLDLAPALYVLPSAYLEIEGYMGIRFYF